MEKRSDGVRRRRTPQACNTCRRRKTKCDGARPRCRHCSARGVACVWSGPGVEPDGPGAPGAATLPDPALPEPRALRRCLDTFLELHCSDTFCAFLYRPDMDGGGVDSPLLATAMVCLCARYLAADEARELFGLASGLHVSRKFTPVARALARASSDEPSVANIQGNLVLAVSEFVSNEGSSPWMYAGTAIRMAQMMRLNNEYHQSHPLKEQEMRRRTFWACFFMDRLLAYFLTKPVTLSAAHVSAALPGTDAALAYQEPSRGLTLDSIRAFGGFPSEVGLLPYLAKTVCLWGYTVDLNVSNHRFVDGRPPTAPDSPFRRRHDDVRRWAEALPASLRWSEASYASHAGLGHGRVFIAMHLLLRSAMCTAHQAYLPQLDGSSILVDAADAAGWSLLRREPALVSACVDSALAAGAMAAHLAGAGPRARAELRSVWVAAALFSVANTLLWLQYANDAEHAAQAARADGYFGLVVDLMAAWAATWPAAGQWCRTLRAMRAMYRAAYLGEVEAVLSELAAAPATHGESPGGFRPRPGDGFLSLDAVPSLSDSLRFLTSDTSAEPKKLQAVWMQFASGWSLDLVAGLATSLEPGEQARAEPRNARSASPGPGTDCWSGLSAYS